MSELTELQEFCEQIQCICLKNEPMSVHTTFKIGGPADLFIRPCDWRQAQQVINKAKQLNLPLIYIGKGSDLLVKDDGIRGVVLSFDELSAVPSICKDDDTLIECPAGVSLTALCLFAQRNSLTGLEFAYGIPGSLGGAVYMNAGAYGGEMCEVVKEVSYLDADGAYKKRNHTDLDFRYRHSWFSDNPECLITGALIRLQKGNAQEIRAKMDDYMKRRKSKQPLEYPSAGSTFKRPVGSYASLLIDQCGLKGRQVGGAMVSDKHAGFVINHHEATCQDVLELIKLVQQEVKEKTGFSLECEIKLL